jgi:hypothetical protein
MGTGFLMACLYLLEMRMMHCMAQNTALLGLVAIGAAHNWLQANWAHLAFM